jgi:hypothetical protein
LSAPDVYQLAEVLMKVRVITCPGGPERE